jgi:hypothetical protein
MVCVIPVHDHVILTSSYVLFQLRSRLNKYHWQMNRLADHSASQSVLFGICAHLVIVLFEQVEAQNEPV